MQSVSLVMMGQNEAHCVVDNVMDCVPHVDEIVFVDGGSTDGTADLMREVPKCKVYEIPFRRHFARQKNAMCDLATGEWVLTKDCDETFDPALWDWLDKLQEAPCNKYRAVAFYRKNTLDGFLVNIDNLDWQVRYWRKDSGVIYQGRYHTRPAGFASHEVLYANIGIIHDKNRAETVIDDMRVRDMGQALVGDWCIKDGELAYEGAVVEIKQEAERERARNPFYGKPYMRPEAGRSLFDKGEDFAALVAHYNFSMNGKHPVTMSTPELLMLSPMEEWVAQWIDGGRLLDVGCGVAKFPLALAYRGTILNGVCLDVSQTMVDMALAGAVELGLPQLEFRHATLDHLDVRERFDVIVMNNSLEHQYSAWQTVEHAHYLLNDNGVLIGMVPEEYSCDTPEHMHHFTEKSLRDLLEEFYGEVKTEVFRYRTSADVDEGKICWCARKV